jgi:hypothetical protein
MSDKTTPELEAAIEERDCLRIQLSLLKHGDGDAKAVVEAEQEIAGAGKRIAQLRRELNPEAQPRSIVRLRGPLAGTPRAQA